MRWALVFVVLVACGVGLAVGESRDWSDSSGRFKVEAELVTVTESLVVLRKSDGKEISVPIARLSDADRDYLKKRNEDSSSDVSPSERPMVGIRYSPITARWKEAFKKDGVSTPPFRGGLIVIEVAPGSPAHAAGIKDLDVVCRIDDQILSTNEDLETWINKAKVGESYKVQILRMGKWPARGLRGWDRQYVELTLASRETVEATAAKHCPLKLVAASLGSNVLDQTTVSVVVENVTTQDVVAFEVSIYCFDRFDDPVKGISGTNRQPGISQKTIRPGARHGDRNHWTLHFRDTASKVRVVLDRVKLEDGTVWKPEEGQEVAITGESKD